MGWDRWKRIFWLAAGVWLSGTIILQIARINSRSYSTILLIDNLTTLFAVLSIAVLVLGVVLFSRWVWQKATGGKVVPGSRPSADRPRATAETRPLPTWTARWTALVEYDDEIRPAVEKLLPYGAEWVKRLGEAFFALNEDRTYLSNIVERLLNEAKLKAANEWKALFTRTADGQFTTKESLAILLDAREKGYKLGAQSGGAFTVSIGSSTSFLYSNEDIRRFGHILAGRPTSSKPAATTENGKWRSQTGKLVCNYELSGLPPPQTTTSLKIECSVSRYLNGTLGTHLRFYLTPYLYLIPHARPFEDHLVKASFALGLVADGSGLGTETSPLVQGGMFEVNASAYEDDPDTVVLGIISSRDTALALKTLAIGTVLTLTLIEHETEPLLYPLRLRLNGDPNFAKLYERLQRSA